MTTQRHDRLIAGADEFPVKPFPLESLGGNWQGKTVGRRFVSRFARCGTACRRGYVATWEIVADRLYLVGFDARDQNGNQLQITDVFDTPRMHAFWFSGALCSPLGKGIYGTYEPIFEQDSVWEFERGVLTSSFVRTNTVPDDGLVTFLESDTQCQSPLYPSFAEQVSQAVNDGKLDNLSHRDADQLQKNLSLAIDAIFNVKAQLLPDYIEDASRTYGNNDKEIEVLRSAWQRASEQSPNEDSSERIERLLREDSL